MTTLKLPRPAGEPPSPADGETVTAEREHKRVGKDEKCAQEADAGAGSGAGSYTSPERLNGATTGLVESRDMEAVAPQAEPASPTDAAQLVNTEDKGHSRTRGEDGQTPRRRGRYLRRRR